MEDAGIKRGNVRRRERNGGGVDAAKILPRRPVQMHGLHEEEVINASEWGGKRHEYLVVVQEQSSAITGMNLSKLVEQGLSLPPGGWRAVIV